MLMIRAKEALTGRNGRVTVPVMRYLPARITAALAVLLQAALIGAQPYTMDFSGPYGISGVLVEGNRQTKERIILRELTIAPGDTVDTKALYERLARSRQNLLNLGLAPGSGVATHTGSGAVMNGGGAGPELQIVAMPTRDADAAGVRLMTATLKTLLADLPLLAERADSVEITVRRP